MKLKVLIRPESVGGYSVSIRHCRAVIPKGKAFGGNREHPRGRGTVARGRIGTDDGQHL